MKRMVAALILVLVFLAFQPVLAESSPEEIYQQAQKWLEEGYPQQAAPLFQRVIELKPKHAEAYLGLGRCFILAQQYPEAIEALNKAAKLKSGYYDAYGWLGDAYLAMNRPNDAVDAYKRAIKAKPDLAQAHNGLGSVYLAIGKTEEARDAFRQAVRFKADWAEAHFNLAMASLELGDLRSTYESLQEAVRSDPDFKLAHVHLGLYHQANGNHAQAITEFTKGLGAYSQMGELAYLDANVHYFLGLSHKALRQQERAEAEFKQALEIDPGHEKAEFVLGQLYFQTKRYELAVYHLSQAVEDKPNQAEPRFWLGQAYAALRQHAEAASAFKVVLVWDARHVGAHAALGREYLALGDKAAAEAEAKALRSLDPEAARELELAINGWTPPAGPEPSLAGAEKPKWRVVAALDNLGHTTDVDKRGEYLFVAVEMNGLVAVDVRNPEQPRIAGSVKVPGDPLRIFIKDERAYVAARWGGLQVVDIANPERMSVIGGLQIPGLVDDVAVLGDRAYVAMFGSGIKIVDVTDAAKLSVVDSLPAADRTPRVFANDTAVYLTDGSGEIRAAGADGQMRSLGKRSELGSVLQAGPQEIYTMLQNRFRILDPSLLPPRVLGSYYLPSVFDVATAGDRAVIANAKGLEVIDLSDRTKPRSLGKVETVSAAEDVVVIGDYAFASEGPAGIEVVFIGKP